MSDSIVPGQKIAVQIGDRLIEDTVHTVRYVSAQPEIRQHPTGWRRLLRAVTPRRWRKPLPIVREYQPATTEVIMSSEYARRAKHSMERTDRALKGMGL